MVPSSDVLRTGFNPLPEAHNPQDGSCGDDQIESSDCEDVKSNWKPSEMGTAGGGEEVLCLWSGSGAGTAVANRSAARLLLTVSLGLTVFAKK